MTGARRSSTAWSSERARWTVRAEVDGEVSEPASLRVIADHIRSGAFLVLDGVLPSNEGRGYVLRRIIRRALRHGHKLGIERPFFHRLVAPLAAEMGDAYPALAERAEAVATVLAQEEARFAETLDQGMRILEQAIANLEGDIIPGAVVFQLYDTYGFPVDLTADMPEDPAVRQAVRRYLRSSVDASPPIAGAEGAP